VPVYLILNRLGWLDTPAALIVPAGAGAFGVFLLAQFFRAVPRELEEAAVMDGSSSWQCFVRVALPLVLPGIVTIALFAFITSWNEFLAALIVMNKETAFTVPVMLVGVRTGHFGSIDWGALQAGIIVSILPCILIYVLLQKYYVSGLLSGAVK
jgi:multiple sugar transport system permease protein